MSDAIVLRVWNDMRAMSPFLPCTRMPSCSHVGLSMFAPYGGHQVLLIGDPRGELMRHEKDPGFPDPERRHDATEILTAVRFFGKRSPNPWKATK